MHLNVLNIWNLFGAFGWIRTVSFRLDLYIGLIGLHLVLQDGSDFFNGLITSHLAGLLFIKDPGAEGRAVT